MNPVLAHEAHGEDLTAFVVLALLALVMVAITAWLYRR